MGLNPLIAARSYIFHVFFILPQELTQEINILFLIHGLCVFVFSVCLPVYLSWKYHHHVLNCTFWKTFSQNASSLPSCFLSESFRPTGGSSLPLSAVKTLCVCCYFCIQHHWQHTGPTAQWVMNELPFITINQWAKPINCQAKDEFVFVRMTDCCCSNASDGCG